jgi:hypothetical protein
MGRSGQSETAKILHVRVVDVNNLLLRTGFVNSFHSTFPGDSPGNWSDPVRLRPIGVCSPAFSPIHAVSVWKNIFLTSSH